MTTAELDAAIAGLRPVELAVLDVTAPLLTRRERKYIVPVDDAVRVVEGLAVGAHSLSIDGRRAFRYASVYFDTPRLDVYHAASRRRPRRYKVRTRAYLDSGRRVLEIKRRDGRGRTAKLRTEHRAAGDDVLDPASLSFLRSWPSIGETATDLEPVLRTQYTRYTLLVEDCARLTIDVELCSTSPDGRAARLCGMAVVETKSATSASAADRALWRLGHRPLRVSKYCTSLAVLRPDLPANTWARALRRRWVADFPAPARLAG